MKNEFSYDSPTQANNIVEPAEVLTNMTYDGVPQMPDADQPIIVVKKDKPDENDKKKTAM